MTEASSALFRALPPAHELLASAAGVALLEKLPRAAVLSLVRSVLANLREQLRAGTVAAERSVLCSLAEKALGEALEKQERAGLRRVLNATGVVLHTNLGRAPLGSMVLSAVKEACEGYASVEFDLATGERGHRDRVVSGLLCALLETEDALVVNNCAAAVLLVATAFAAGRDVLVSRGELVEIGGGFRVPDVLSSCGARLVEVGTTNKTRVEDYERAWSERTSMLLSVHRSNFAIVGFTQDPSLAALAALAKAKGVPLVRDVGSGAMLSWGTSKEPTPLEDLREGASLVLFSGDKLLGGPQAGIVAGQAKYVAQLRKHPLMRALRPGRLVLSALEAVLRSYAKGRATEELPVLQMLSVSEEVLKARAAELLTLISQENSSKHNALSVCSLEGRVGGGSMPLAQLRSWGVAVEGPASLLLRLLREEPSVPIVARIEQDRVVLDVRTLSAEELSLVARGVAHALRALQEIEGRKHEPLRSSLLSSEVEGDDDG